MEKGLYELYDSSFAAHEGVKYNLQISSAEEVYESSWEEFPGTSVPPIGPVDFVEGESQSYVVESGEKVLRTIKT